MRRFLAVSLLVVGCSGAANCTELQQQLRTAANSELWDIWQQGQDMAADALARGADGEARLCAAVAEAAGSRALGTD
jgi:hypothetical protein